MCDASSYAPENLCLNTNTTYITYGQITIRKMPQTFQAHTFNQPTIIVLFFLNAISDPMLWYMAHARALNFIFGINLATNAPAMRTEIDSGINQSQFRSFSTN